MSFGASDDGASSGAPSAAGAGESSTDVLVGGVAGDEGGSGVGSGGEGGEGGVVGAGCGDRPGDGSGPDGDGDGPGDGCVGAAPDQRRLESRCRVQ